MFGLKIMTYPLGAADAAFYRSASSSADPST